MRHYRAHDDAIVMEYEFFMNIDIRIENVSNERFHPQRIAQGYVW